MRYLIGLILFANTVFGQSAAATSTKPATYIAKRYMNYNLAVDTSRFCPQYQEVLTYAENNGIATPPLTVKILDDQLMRQMVIDGVYRKLRNGKLSYFYNFNLTDTAYQDFRKLNWIDTSKYHLTEVGNVAWILGEGVHSDSNAYFKGASYLEADSAIFNTYGLGAYVSTPFIERLGGGGGVVIGTATDAFGPTQSTTRLSRGGELVGGIYITAASIKTAGGLPLTPRIEPRIEDFPNLFYAYRSSPDTAAIYAGGFTLNSDLIDSALGATGDVYQNAGFFALLASNQSYYNANTGALLYDTITNYTLDTISHIYGGSANLSDKVDALKNAINSYNTNMSILVDTINIMTNFYFQGVDSNDVVPMLPRRNDQFGMEFQPPRASADSFAIHRVTNPYFSENAVGSLRWAIDQAEADGKYSFILIETSGLMDTNYFEGTVINEDKGLWIFGQFAPSPGFRIMNTEFNVRPESAPVVMQHLRFSAGLDTLPGVARDSCVANCVFDTVLNKFVGWTQYTERDNIKAGVNNFISDHNTYNLAPDELAQTRGSNQTWSYNLFTKPLASNLHHKGAHPKGSIHFKQGVGEGKNLAFYRNGYFGTRDRTPQLGGQVTGILQETYAYGQKFGTQLVGGDTYADDTLGGFHVMNINRMYYDKSERFSIRFKPNLLTSGAINTKFFDINGLMYPNPQDSLNELSENTIVFQEIVNPPDSFFVSTPPFEFKQAPTIPFYKARKFIYTFAGARPADRDTLEKVAIAEVISRVDNVPPPNMSYWRPLLTTWYANPTHTPAVLPNDSLTTDSTGYLGIERMADSLHWKVTYPDSIAYPGIEADPTGAFMYDLDNPFLVPKFEAFKKETAWRETA